MWKHPWPPYIIAALISNRNPEWTLKNSDVKLVALVLHEATLLDACPEAKMAAPHSGPDNTPTVSCITREALTINPVVTEHLRIRVLHSR